MSPSYHHHHHTRTHTSVNMFRPTQLYPFTFANAGHAFFARPQRPQRTWVKWENCMAEH